MSNQSAVKSTCQLNFNSPSPTHSRSLSIPSADFPVPFEDKYIRACSYSGLAPSPAISFLSTLAECTAPTLAPAAVEGRLKVGLVLQQRFLLTTCLKQSALGSCWKARDVQKGGEFIFLKVVSAEGAFADFEREIEVWRQVSGIGSTHILPLLGSFWHHEKSTEMHSTRSALVAVAPFCEGGTLLGIPAGFRGWKALFLQLVEAVCWIHALGIAHNDLKLDNVVLNKRGKVFLADFGLASPWNYASYVSKNSAELGGTLAYCAPEVLNATSVDIHDLRVADCWSLGVIAYALVVGEFPFGADAGDGETMLRARILEAKWKPIGDVEIDGLLNGLFQLDCSKRYTAETVRHVLNKT